MIAVLAKNTNTYAQNTAAVRIDNLQEFFIYIR